MVSRPHGGRLVKRVATGRRRERLVLETTEMYSLDLTYEQAIDTEDLGRGVFSPLEGFVVEDDFLSILNYMRLTNDVPWTIPIVLDVDRERARKISMGDEIALWYNNVPLAIMRVEDLYQWDKYKYVESVFGTKSPEHPGVAKVRSMGEFLLGGPVELVGEVETGLERYILWPDETRVLFSELRWRTIVGFQTRNVPHMGHEYVQKSALVFVDGLFINPLIGWKKKGDYRDEVIFEAYKVLIEHYYPRKSAVLAGLKMNMRYAGPREAVHHAIVRKNFGCTHFIVGRDHAGVGDFYSPYEAWEIFEEFPDLGITPLFIREAFYCRKCGGMVNEKICPHEEEFRVRISGTKIREMLSRGERPPSEMMRPEVADRIISFRKPFVE